MLLDNSVECVYKSVQFVSVTFSGSGLLPRDGMCWLLMMFATLTLTVKDCVAMVEFFCRSLSAMIII